MKVHISYEARRECGFRSPGKDGVGIYLRGSGLNEACERLPWLLDKCPCCGGQYRQSRGFTWIDPMSMFDPYTEPRCTATVYPELYNDDLFAKHRHEQCWMCNPELLGSKAGLIWIGEKFYARPVNFLKEAEIMGISRKLGALPNGFRVGEHVIFLAHSRTFSNRLPDGKIEYKPGVFAAFKPTSVDLVIDDENWIPDKALELAKRIGEDKVRIVKVIPDKSEAEEGIWSDMEEA